MRKVHTPVYDWDDDAASIRLGDTLEQTIRNAFWAGLLAGTPDPRPEDEEEDPEPFDGLGRR